ncbi:MAG: hypothetical protein ABIS00_14585 [Gemmatimonadales bacterium]
MRTNRIIWAIAALLIAFRLPATAQDSSPRRSAPLSGRTVAAPYTLPGLRAAVLSLSRVDSTRPPLTVARDEEDMHRSFTVCDGLACHLRGTKQVIAATGERLLPDGRGEATVSMWLDTREHGITGGRTIWLLDYRDGEWRFVGGRDDVVE